MKIEFAKLSEFQQWLVITMVTSMEGMGADDKIDEHPYYKKLHEENNGMHELTLMDNGFELDPLKAFDEIEKQMKRMVEEKAEELLRQKLIDTLAPLADSVRAVEDHIFMKFGVKKEEDW